MNPILPSVHSAVSSAVQSTVKVLREPTEKWRYFMCFVQTSWCYVPLCTASGSVLTTLKLLPMALLLFEYHKRVAPVFHNYQRCDYNYHKAKLQLSPREMHWQTLLGFLYNLIKEYMSTNKISWKASDPKNIGEVCKRDLLSDRSLNECKLNIPLTNCGKGWASPGWMVSPQSHHSWSQEWEAYPTSHLVQGLAVGLLCLIAIMEASFL